MEWHVLRRSDDTTLDILAERYRLHPLHIEDCRHGDQTAKLEEGVGYSFVVLKPADLNGQGELSIGDFDIFIGPDFLITFEETESRSVRQVISRLQDQPPDTRSDQLFYRIFDAIVDSYRPVLDYFSEEIDSLQDQILLSPEPALLERIFDVKRALIHMRRVLTPSRDIVNHMQRANGTRSAAELSPYYRDVYDHLARNIDTVEMLRDLLNGSLDIYLSSVANRTNQVMKVLTVLSTVALPALIISSFYGMNFEHLPGLKSPYGVLYATGAVIGSSLLLLAGLRWVRWI